MSMREKVIVMASSPPEILRKILRYAGVWVLICTYT